MKRKEKIRKDYAFWRQFDEKPSIIPGCLREQLLLSFCDRSAMQGLVRLHQDGSTDMTPAIAIPYRTTRGGLLGTVPGVSVQCYLEACTPARL